MDGVDVVLSEEGEGREGVCWEGRRLLKQLVRKGLADLATLFIRNERLVRISQMTKKEP